MKATVKANDFHDALRTVRPFVFTGETRYYLNGVFLRVSGSFIEFVATDGHRMARARRDATGCEDGGAILSTESADAMLALPEAKKDVAIDAADGKIAILYGDLRIKHKAIDGTYPDYEAAQAAHRGPYRLDFDQRYLREMAKSLTRENPVKMRFGGAGQCASFCETLPSGGENEIVIMPMRGVK